MKPKDKRDWLGDSEVETESDRQAAAAMKRKTDLTSEITAQFELIMNREEAGEVLGIQQIVGKCEVCKVIGFNEEHHSEDLKKKFNITQEKNQQDLILLKDELMNENRLKEEKVQMLKGKASLRPLFDKDDLMRQEEAFEKMEVVQKLIESAKNENSLQLVEKDRVIHVYNEMLKDKLVLLNKMEDTERNLNLTKGLRHFQNDLKSNPKSKKMDDMMDDALLRLEQENIVKMLIFHEEEKKLKELENERVNMVDSNDQDIPTSGWYDCQRRS